jgi:peptidoglycan/xylan/chitin deacetylase (PgdA/CDA1 family)
VELRLNTRRTEGPEGYSATAAPSRATSLRQSEAVQRLKSVILKPVGTVTSLFDVADVVSLTFDDGPDAEVTPRMLEVLRRHQAKATFFVLTDEAERRPELLRQLLAEGHEVGLHFDRHDPIPTLKPPVAFRRMAAARDRLAELAGRPVTLFRPPYGRQNYLTYGFARVLGLTVVGWSRCANDWMDHLSAAESAQAVTAQLAGGDIILQHDGLALTAEEARPTLDRVAVADLILTEATRRGLASVTVSALLGRGPRRLSHWFR